MHSWVKDDGRDLRCLFGVEQHIKLVGFTTSRNMTLPSDPGYRFRSDGEF